MTAGASAGTTTSPRPTSGAPAGDAAPAPLGAALPPHETRTFAHDRASVHLMLLCALAAVPLTGLALLLPVLAPDTSPLLAIGCVVGFGCAGIGSYLVARGMRRYGFTAGPTGFREAPRHPFGTEISWTRVARIVPRSDPGIELRDARDEVLGSLSLDVMEFETAFETILARSSHARASFPASFRVVMWPWVVIGGIGAAAVAHVGWNAWIADGARGSVLALAGIWIGIASLLLLTSTRRTDVERDGVRTWRGFGSRFVRWCDIERLSLGGVGRIPGVLAHLGHGSRVQIAPSGGDFVGVLQSARAAHHAYRSISSTERRGSA